MPSRLATTTANQLTLVKLRQQIQAVAGTGVQTLPIRGPFTGFTPDIDPNLLDGTTFRSLTNCLARSHGNDHGEVLGLPDGYRQVDAARLPLGDGSTLPASPVTDATAVVRIDQCTRFAPTGHASPGEFTGEFIPTGMVVTAGTGTAGTGNMYRINAAGQWVQVAPAASMTATTRQLSANRDGRTTSFSMPDSCTAPFGAVARAANTAGNDDKQSGPISEPCWIFTNDVDEVMVFPASTVGTLAGTHVYEPLVDHISSVDLDAGGTSGFKCKSVETWNGRIYFLNTSEANTRRSQRLRRTAKFTADPMTSIVGAGFYDFREFQGEGLRIETLGDVLAVYFSDGVAFMRPTGNPTSPDEPQVVATERGLLGTHCVTAIGRNVHFGIFTDGWWLLDQSGRWQEVGVSQIQGKQVPKWRQTFYDNLPLTFRDRIYCYYDQPSNLVYIAVPTLDANSPEEVWIYDPTSDRVFLENYAVTCFGSFAPVLVAAVTIDALPGTIDSLVGTIDSFGSVVGFPKARLHGDPTGFVYSHSRTVDGFDSATNPAVVQDPSWSFGLGLRSPAGMRNLTSIDRVSLEYFNHGNLANVSLQVLGPSADGSQTRSVLLTGGDNENVRVRDAWFRYSTTEPGLTVSGTGEYHIRALEIDLFADPVEPRGT
jgi:hypothetical protein